uniref:Uncharacterized protein n=1 Tax=Anopheles stephensi TaxID=30069 RepID=A0A182YCG6_ANOST
MYTQALIDLWRVRANSAGILQKWSKLRRRCASFKSVSGPASLDSDTNFILAEHPGHYQIISTATGSPVPPRAALVPSQSKPPSQPHHHHHHPLYHGHHHHHSPHHHHQLHHLPHRAHPHHPHHHQHHHSHLHQQQQHQLHHHPLVDYPLPGSHLLDGPPPLASGYDPKNWELRHSSSSSASASSSSTIGAPPAIPASAGLGLPGDEYWHHFPHEPSDVKLWRLGAHQTYAHRIHVNPPQRRSAHSIDWEYNVQRYENMCDNMAPPPQRIFRTEKLQYYDELADVKRTTAATDAGVGTGLESSGGIKVAKEIKLPSLKTFKSASMRLPGQKSSIHEVQQLLRSKFNRIHAGLRKRRALSVQEVFQIPGAPGPAGAQATPTKPTFYVPSPLVSERTPHRGVQTPRYNEEDEADGTGVPFLDEQERLDRQDTLPPGQQDEDEGPVSLPYISETMLADTTASAKKVTLRSTDHSPSPRKERTKTWYRSIDFNAALQKLDSQRHSLDTSAKGTPKKQPEPEPAARERNRTTDEPQQPAATKPNFSIGGRVSLRERVENMNLSRLRPSKMTSTSSATSNNGSPVPSPTPVAAVKKLSDARKIRPRSHSPLKNIKINLSPVKKSNAVPLAGGTPAGDKASSKRESIGLFGRLNRMMHQHGLGGLSSSGDKPTDPGARKQNGKPGTLAVSNGAPAAKNGSEDGSVTSAVGTRTGTDKVIGSSTNHGVSFGGNVSKQSTIQKLTQLSSCNRREQQQQQQMQQSKTETTQERDRKSKQYNGRR